MTHTLKNSKRIISYDMIRIIAILSVILIHSAAKYVTSFPTDSLDFLFGNLFDSIARIAVPLFVMLSGALLLREDKVFDFKEMKKYVIRIFCLLYSWSFILAVFYQIVLPFFEEQTISLKALVRAFLFGHYHQWYLFMIIGIYLVTPILKLFTKRENKKYILWFILLSILAQFSIPILNFLINHITGSSDVLLEYSSEFSLNFVSNFITYYFLVL